MALKFLIMEENFPVKTVCKNHKLILFADNFYQNEMAFCWSDIFKGKIVTLAERNTKTLQV